MYNISNSMNQETKDKMYQTRLKNSNRRKDKELVSFELKVDMSHLNKHQKEHFKMFFVESKRFYNHIVLYVKDIFKFDTKTKIVNVKRHDGTIDQKEIRFLPARIKQNIHRGAIDNIKSLSSKKKKGKFKEVGKLKPKGDYDSIEFDKQAFKIKSKNRIWLLGVKGYIRVNGLNQIKPEYETASAKLIKKASGYYIKITCYRDKIPKAKTNRAVGIDMGITTTLTTSDGEKIGVMVEEGERLKQVQRKLAKQVKGSNNYYKTRLKLQKEYDKLNNKKDDLANKVFHDLKLKYDYICMQDENLKGWQKGRYGRVVQHSILGRLKSRLKNWEHTYVIDRFAPTTKTCYQCGMINDVPLDQRTYKCDCGLIEDRDIKAAKTILKMAQKQYNLEVPAEKLVQVPTERLVHVPVERLIPTERREFTPVESITSVNQKRVHKLAHRSRKLLLEQ